MKDRYRWVTSSLAAAGAVFFPPRWCGPEAGAGRVLGPDRGRPTTAELWQPGVRSGGKSGTEGGQMGTNQSQTALW